MLQVIRQASLTRQRIALTMQPHTSAQKASTAPKPNRILTAVPALFASLLAMLVPKASATTDARGVATSRRAMLSMAREEAASGDAMKDIAISFVLLGIALVIALTFWPVITSSVAEAQADTNTTGSTDTLLGLIPLLLVVILLIGCIGFLFKGIQSFRS